MADDDGGRRLGRALLDRPAQHSVRAIASVLLEDVIAAHAGLESDEADALHDLRVAMRRLRSWLRAFRPELSDTVRGRTRRKLRALASATNDARDAEVTLAFIERQADVPPRARAAIRELVAELEKACVDSARDTRRALDRDLRKTTRALAEQIESWWERHRLDESSTPRPMSAVFADAIRHQVRRMASGLARIDRTDKADDVHRARIAAKRLRYLLEPLDEEMEAAEPIRQLRSLQRQLGDARDAHRIAVSLIREVGERAARDARGRALAASGIVPDGDAVPRSVAGTRSALAELARRAQAAREAAHAEFAAQWGSEALASFVERVETIAARVEAA